MIGFILVLAEPEKLLLRNTKKVHKNKKRKVLFKNLLADNTSVWVASSKKSLNKAPPPLVVVELFSGSGQKFFYILNFILPNTNKKLNYLPAPLELALPPLPPD